MPVTGEGGSIDLNGAEDVDRAAVDAYPGGAVIIRQADPAGGDLRLPGLGPAPHYGESI